MENLYTRELAKYILFKKYESYQPKNMQDKNELDISREDINKIKIELDHFILLTRLIKEGRIQVYKGYFFSPIYYSCFQLHSSTSIDHIRPFFYSEKPLFENHYEFNKTVLKEIV